MSQVYGLERPNPFTLELLVRSESLTQVIRWLLAGAWLALGCSVEDHPSLGRYAPNIPAQPPAMDMDMDARGGAGGATAPGTGARASTSSTPAADSGTSHARMSMADAANPDAQPTPDSGAIDSGTDAGSSCAGVYRGDFSCTVIDPPMTGLPMAMTAITMTLQPSQEASVSIASANVSFTFQTFLVEGTLSGQLDCTTHVFHADIVDGLFASEVAPLPIPLSGVIDGAHDRATRSLAGTWSFTSPVGGECTGPWRAKLQP